MPKRESKTGKGFGANKSCGPRLRVNRNSQVKEEGAWKSPPKRIAPVLKRFPNESQRITGNFEKACCPEKKSYNW